MTEEHSFSQINYNKETGRLRTFICCNRSPANNGTNYNANKVRISLQKNDKTDDAIFAYFISAKSVSANRFKLYNVS